MGQETEVVEPQKTTPEAATEEVSQVTISQAELEDLKHKATVSSQNFERLKKAESRLKELEQLQTNTPFGTEDVFSDEGKVLKKQIDAFKAEVAELKAESTRKDLQASNPIFKERWEEFEAFRNDPENKGMNMRTAAKAFLVENGLIDAAPRKGLEKPTGGPRTPTPSGMTVEDVSEIRKNQPRLYRDLIKQGKIRFD